MNAQVQPTGEPRSLREAKRTETLRNLYLSATTLVLERGFDEVTVEDICKEAKISRRTFFNYVDSKETAIFGPAPTPPPPEALDAFVAQRHDNLVRATLDFLLEHFALTQDPDHSGELLRNRHTICRKNPELTARRLSYGAELFEVITDTIERYLEAHPQDRKVPDGTAYQEAQTVVACAASAKHLGSMWWVNTQRREATADLESAMDSLHRYAHQALDNFILVYGEDR